MWNVRKSLTVAGLLATLWFCSSAKADTVYTFQNTFNSVNGIYQIGDQITGTFVLSDSFVPGPIQTYGGSPWTSVDITSGIVSYDFTDGHQTFTQDNSTITGFLLGLNGGATPTGDSSWWSFGFSSATGSISSSNVPSTTSSGEVFITSASDGTSSASNFSGGHPNASPGTWTVEAVPEGGSTVLLLAIGLLLLPFLIYIRHD
jgi:hypothetical protein